MTRFALDPLFIASYSSVPVKFGPLGLLAFARTYSRPIDMNDPSKGQERWVDTVARIVSGVYSFQKLHCLDIGRPWSEIKAQRSAQEMFRRIFEMKFVPPGRGLWSMGTDFVFERGSTALQNCAFLSTVTGTLSDTMCLIMDLLMHGVGVGSDVMGSGRWKIIQPLVSDDIHVVPDTREGWVDAVRRLLAAYTGESSLPFSWDLSSIRAEGLPIKSFGGTAPGPEPLRKLLTMLETILDTHRDKRLGTRGIADIINLIGVCVVAGGIRRSAEILIGNHDDEVFLDLKSDALAEERPWMWTSNNTIFADDIKDFRPFAARTAQKGEPGYLFMKNARAFGRMGDSPNWKDENAKGVNPCGEQTLFDGELCNLVETFIGRHNSAADWCETLKYAYLYAKSVTLVECHHKRLNNIMMKNRRIGTSIAGALPMKERLGTKAFVQWLRTGYDFIQNLDAVYSKWLNVPQSIKTTTIKPGGTTPLLPGEMPGINADHSPYYLRRVTVEKTSSLVDLYRSHGYHVEPVIKQEERSVVISVPVKSSSTHFKGDYSIGDQLKLNALMQRHWSDNQVSQSVTFKPKDAPVIAGLLEKYRSRVKSLAMFPEYEGGTYAQQPYEEITAEQYAELQSKITDVSEADALTGHIVHDTEERYCDGDSCVL